MGTHLTYSRMFPVSLGEAFSVTMTAPLPGFLGDRYLAIPGVTRVIGAQTWGEAGVGQQRTLHFSDGGSARETMTSLVCPRAFGYTLDSIHGPMKALASKVDGVWAFEPVGTGTRITWTWDVSPTNAAARLAMPVFGQNWKGAAQRAFDRLETILVD